MCLLNEAIDFNKAIVKPRRRQTKAAEEEKHKEMLNSKSVRRCLPSPLCFPTVSNPNVELISQGPNGDAGPRGQGVGSIVKLACERLSP